ncbi:MAG: hypothetical protein WD225_06495 [Ilumatobacteraceae bacterium]
MARIPSDGCIFSRPPRTPSELMAEIAAATAALPGHPDRRSSGA